MQHYIRNHKQDPYFRITCVQPGCGATFKKWKSFRQHLFRKHPTASPTLNEVTQQIEDENQLTRTKKNYRKLFKKTIKKLLRKLLKSIEKP